VKRKIQAALSFLMILVLFTGTTGITFFIHTCSGSQKTEITAYPEFFKHASTCCCSDENASQETGISPTPELKKPSCCRNQNLFLKSYVSTAPSVQSVTGKTILFPLYPEGLLVSFTHYKQPAVTEYLAWQDHSPPWTGKSLIFFIHQIRIPSPVC